MGFGSPPAPPSIPMPPPAAHPATLANPAVGLAGQASKRAAAAAEGLGVGGTVATSPQGLTKPETAKTTLLGG